MDDNENGIITYDRSGYIALQMIMWDNRRITFNYVPGNDGDYVRFWTENNQGSEQEFASGSARVWKGSTAEVQAKNLAAEHGARVMTEEAFDAWFAVRAREGNDDLRRVEANG